MPSIPIHTSSSLLSNTDTPTNNPLPQLLQTPSGLALLEIQGTIHAPFPQASLDNDSLITAPVQTDIGRLEFPLYDPSTPDEERKWMRKVYLYVGKHQRLTGEVKKLPRAIAVIRKRQSTGEHDGSEEGAGEEELEIAEIVQWKILFAGRPEPVGGEEV